jgi:hypothetical protein
MQLTIEEVLSLLRLLSQIEGFLFSVPNSKIMADQLEAPVNMLIEKLKDL